MTGVMLGLFIFWFIVGIAIILSFSYIIFDLQGFIIGKIVGNCFFAGIMTGITLYFWYIPMIIMFIIGIVFAVTLKHPIAKIIGLIIFVIIGIVIAIVGNRIRKESDIQTYDEEYERTYFNYKENDMSLIAGEYERIDDNRNNEDEWNNGMYIEVYKDDDGNFSNGDYIGYAWGSEYEGVDGELQVYLWSDNEVIIELETVTLWKLMCMTALTTMLLVN